MEFYSTNRFIGGDILHKTLPSQQIFFEVLAAPVRSDANLSVRLRGTKNGPSPATLGHQGFVH